MRKPHINTIPNEMRDLVRRLCTLDFIRLGTMENCYQPTEPEHAIYAARAQELETIVTAMGDRNLARRCVKWR